MMKWAICDVAPVLMPMLHAMSHGHTLCFCIYTGVDVAADGLWAIEDDWRRFCER